MSPLTDATTELGLLAIPKREAGRRLSIILSLVLVLAAAGASLFLVRSVDTQLSDIANTYEVRRQARELILAVVDAVTGQRGYLITQDAQYLETYELATATLDTTSRNLVKLIEGNPEQL